MKACVYWSLALALSFASATNAYPIDAAYLQTTLQNLAVQVAVDDAGAELDGIVYFPGHTLQHGSELWRTDGTATGTRLVADIFPGPGSAAPYGLIATGGRLFFQAEDGTHGRELWTLASLQGVEETRLVKDIFPGPAASSPAYFAELNGRVYFSAGLPGVGVELWSSDGTASGTFLVSDIARGAGSSYPSYLTRHDNRLFFRASDGIVGSELWATDGTLAGTMLVKDILPGPAHSSVFHLHSLNGALYFRARDHGGNVRLWVSNGNSYGTLPLQNIVPGEARLRWSATTHNLDRSLLFEPVRYRIYFGTDLASLFDYVELPPGKLSYGFSYLPPGRFYFSVSAVSPGNLEGPRSRVVSKQIY